MTTLDRVRRAALALPEVDEGTHFGMVAFSVRGKGFASVTKDGGRLQLQLPAEQVEAVVADHPGAEPVVRAGTPIGVSLPLAGLDTDALDRLLERSWASRAPKRLVAAHRS